MQPTLTTPFQHIEASLAGTTVRILRADDTGADGYNILTPRDATESVWQKLLQSGDRLGLQPVGFAALNMLRVEAGIPWYGIDMDEERIALEVGLDHALSFTKGCYVGQEVVERASSRGRVNRKLSGLLLEGDTAPHAGDKLFHDSQEVGWITSAVLSPRLGRPVALGYVRREHLEPGTRLRVDRSGIAVIAEVASLPFGP
jgi:folate-binding protein YgfZ